MKIHKVPVKVAIALLLSIFYNSAIAQINHQPMKKPSMSSAENVHYRDLKVNGLKIFYREAGPLNAPVILLLHGYPTSSFMFRNLIPILSRNYHVIAPDMPAFGFSDAPDRENFTYTFDNIANVMQGFIDELALKHFAIYVFDYGAPVGFRLITANPEKITAIISQNGNAYEQGLSTGWNPVQKYWKEPTKKNRDQLKQFLTIDATNFQYRTGVADQSLIAPETIALDQHFLDRPGNVEIQLDLLKDYANNVKLYPAWQAYLRKYHPPLLAVWGDKDPYFLPAGAEGYKIDNPNAHVKFYNTGHFALETNCEEIGKDILTFLDALPYKPH
ncbi:pimeloyl-ACP methyl ester carboxylesterase [Pedobacter sp. UYP30]|uniref:alpha/beta fold hydrolase n=1 Tax=Pedobacter sp. UYP30 TaxID=1756400 RepID=UPI003392D7AE